MPPPRIPLPSGILAPRWVFPNSTSIASRFASTAAQRQRRRKHQDPYAAAQARARKAANLSRQATLQAERSKALGDPVRGVTTPFISSFDTATPLSARTSHLQPATSDTGTEGERDGAPEHLNHFVSQSALRSAVEYSTNLSTPVANPRAPGHDEQVHQERVQQHATESANAAEALRRIVGVDNASAKARLHLNIQRCIDTFGRHNTDDFLRARPNKAAESAEMRAGPDTGSSEVQAAILTARIRALANALETTGKKDKANKRNLRLLVHRRQKLLRYLRRRERGGERWVYLVETLGLTDGTWKGEISM